jgi:hypothetical protein
LGTLEALRENGFKGTITMIGNEGYNPIDRTKLSKALIDDPSKILLRDDAWFKDGAVDVVSDEVTGVDFSAKKVKTKGGSSFQYTKLVLATGGTPKSLPLPGFKELENIFLLRNIPHVKAINAAIGEGKKKIVIIGSSFIGKWPFSSCFQEFESLNQRPTISRTFKVVSSSSSRHRILDIANSMCSIQMTDIHDSKSLSNITNIH